MKNHEQFYQCSDNYPFYLMNNFGNENIKQEHRGDRMFLFLIVKPNLFLSEMNYIIQILEN
ncbi:hypothetical protein Xenpb_01163 [Xenorhabdus sp. PB62.4]|nr:hypothetical protein [Xenorhabdus sp. PB62.4]